MKLFWMLSAVVVSTAGCQLIELPASVAPAKVNWSQAQNWTPAVRDGFYHMPQGSELLPYAWLLALEQPAIPWTVFGEVPLFMDDAYMSRLGFLPDAKSALNPDGLPVGFVKDAKWKSPHTGEHVVMAGLTCAACHTGQLEISKDGAVEALRVDGGSAMIDLQRFEKALGAAVLLTEKLPMRFDRFAHRVLGDSYNDESKSALRAEFKTFLKKGLAENKLNKEHDVFPHPPGFGRVDALNRIGNQVFGLEVDSENLATADAPVSFPFLWGAGWFNYVQYNGSVPQPLIRNVGEALGVRTPFVGKGKPEDLFKSAVHVENLWLMEEWLSGSAPYEGLRAPVWPEATFGAVDIKLATVGASLYAQHCASCHLGDVASIKADRAEKSPKYWTAANFRGDRLLAVKNYPLEQIGTDPNQAKGFATRMADTKDIGKGTVLAGAALDYVSSQVALRYFADNKIPEAEQIVWNAGHKISAEGARVEIAYKARPLDGVWASPPFLHNGSVPTIYALLLPVNKRPPKFSLGSRRYDTSHLGYMTEPFKGDSEFDVRVSGNSNAGHEFADKPQGAGVIGPLLTDEQRMAIIEYLKTL